MAFGCSLCATSTLSRCPPARYNKVLFAAWLALFVASAVVGPRLLTATSSAYTAPPGSPSAAAVKRLGAAFPALAHTSNLVLYMEATGPNATVLTPELAQFQLDVRREALAWRPGFVKTIVSHAIALDQNLTAAVASQFVAADHTAGIMEIAIACEATSQTGARFAKYLQNRVGVLQQRLRRTYALTVTGIPAIMNPLTAEVEHELELMDSIVLPLAMVVLAYVLGSARLLITTVCCIGTSVLVTFSITYFIALKTEILSFIPSFAMSLLLALSIDYSLFINTRFVEALKRGATPLEATEQATSTGARTILVSGGCLFFSFMGLCTFPLAMLRGLGLACATAILTCALVNLLGTPLLLASFPNFFAKCVQPVSWPCRKQGSTAAAASPSSAGDRSVDFHANRSGEHRPLLGTVDTRVGSPSSSPRAVPEHAASAQFFITLQRWVGDGFCGVWAVHYQRGLFLTTATGSLSVLRVLCVSLCLCVPPRSSCWWRLTTVLTKFPFNVLILLVAAGATLPLCLHALRYNATDSLFLVMPRGEPATAALRRMTNEFGLGSTFPYSLLVELRHPAPNDTIVTQQHFDTIAQVVHHLAAAVHEQGTTPADFSGVACLGGIANSAALVNSCLHGGTNVLCPLMKFLASSTLNPASTATLLTIQAHTFDPLSHSGLTWIRRFRAAMATEMLRTNFTLSVTGVPPSSMDSITQSYDLAPRMCACPGPAPLLFHALPVLYRR